MTGPEIAFTVTALVGLATAVRMATARNLVHGVLFMVVTLAAVGAAYLLFAAEFLGWVQILIYVGTLVVLFLFGLIADEGPDRPPGHAQPAAGPRRPRGAGGDGRARRSDPQRLRLVRSPCGYRADHGRCAGPGILRDSVLPFEAVSFVLLAALIGAAVLARKDDPR